MSCPTGWPRYAAFSRATATPESRDPRGEGTPDALTAAAQIARGVDRDLYAVGLSPAERTAVLACLEDPADGLVELRGALLREHRS